MHLGSISPHIVKVGDLVILTGTGFVGITGVELCGASAAFTVDSATQITATVPRRAKGANGPVTVYDAAGPSNTILGLTPVIPGPWVQPDDTWESDDVERRAIYTDDEPDQMSQPDPGGTGSGSTGGGSGRYFVEESLDFSGAFAGWRFIQEVHVVLLDLAPVIAELDQVTPPDAVLYEPGTTIFLPGIEGYEFEADWGTALGPVQVTIGPGPVGINVAGEDQTNDGARPTDPTPILESRGRLARLDITDYSYDPVALAVRLSPDTFPTRAFLAAHTPMIDAPMARSSADVTSTTETAFPFTSTLTSNYAIDPTVLDLDLADLDDDARYAVMLWVDRTETGDQIPLSEPPFPGGNLYTAEIFGGSGVLTSQVYYRPPRWRLLIDNPGLGPPTVRQRQIPGEVRQRQTGSVVRQRQIPR